MSGNEEHYYRYLLTSEVGASMADQHRRNIADYFWGILNSNNCRRVADIGCGLGFFVEHAPAGIEATGVDSNRLVVEHCVARGVSAVHGDAGNLPLADASYDGVFCSHLLEHLSAPETAMREFARVLAQGGLLVVRVPPFNDSFYDDWTHVRPYTEKTLARLAEASGFSVVRLYRYHYDLPFRATAIMKLFNRVRHLSLVEWLVDCAIKLYGLPPLEIVLIARKI